MKYWLTVDDDRLDRIALKTYGTESAVSAILEANPGLAAQPALLPAGVVIALPDGYTSPTQASQPKVRLW